MCLYLRNNFHVSSIILTSFKQGVILTPPTAKRTPKKPTQIRVNELLFLQTTITVWHKNETFVIDDNKLSYDQHFSELPWIKSWFQIFTGKEQGKHGDGEERAKSNNCDTNGIE